MIFFVFSGAKLQNIFYFCNAKGEFFGFMLIFI